MRRLFLVLLLLAVQSCGEEPLCCPLPSAWGFCETNGGELESRSGPGGEYSMCVFPDGSECDPYAFERGDCSPGDCDNYSTCFVGLPCSARGKCPAGVCVDDDPEDATSGICSAICEVNADCESEVIGQSSWTCDTLQDPTATMPTFDRLVGCIGPVNEQPYGCRIYDEMSACMPSDWQR